MTPLELLLQLQELDFMMRELADEKAVSQERKLGFTLKNIEMLKETRDDLARKVDSELLKRYERVVARHPRAIVPMRQGVCLGCFMRQPAQRAVGDAPDPAQVETCLHCGRILFRSGAA